MTLGKEEGSSATSNVRDVTDVSPMSVGRRKKEEGRGGREVMQKEGSFPGNGQERHSARLCLVKQEANGSDQAFPGKAGGTSLRAGERAYKLPAQSRIKLAGGYLISCCF
ncbi:hypothetical protein [Microcoleus vaginatus]|uniref:hypothetical protein n=1 Tax=Microcoleus vaginatus TaxID=119532 RepID=UPI0032A15257